MNNNVKKSEILFLYETSYNIPNGDPLLVNSVMMKKPKGSGKRCKDKKIYQNILKKAITSLCK